MMIRSIFLLLCAVAFAYAAAYAWRRKNGGSPAENGDRFRPSLGFTRLDGMESLSLLLANESREPVWVEEIELFLSGLKADQQTAEPSCHEIQKVRQTVRGGDMLPISLAQAIYNAAGDPQRRYTCLISSVVRYRIGEQSLEKPMETYRIQMIGLKASSMHRERKASPLLPAQVKCEDDRTVALKPK